MGFIDRLFRRSRHEEFLEAELRRVQEEYKRLVNSVLTSNRMQPITDQAQSEPQKIKRKLMPSQFVRMNEKLTAIKAEKEQAG